jgi:hypothetical protein
VHPRGAQWHLFMKTEVCLVFTSHFRRQLQTHIIIDLPSKAAMCTDGIFYAPSKYDFFILTTRGLLTITYREHRHRPGSSLRPRALQRRQCFLRRGGLPR